MKKISIPYTKDNKILDILTDKELQYVNEIYMPLPYDIMPSGRAYNEKENKEYKNIFHTQIKKAKDLGLKVNLLATKPILDIDNGIRLITRTTRELKHIKEICNADKVSIGSIVFLTMYGKYINDLGYDIELSILANIDSTEKVEQIMTMYPFVNCICLGNSFIHRLDELKYIKSKYKNLKLKILVNHLCICNCISHIEHHNLFSNEIYDIMDIDTNNMNTWRLASNAHQLLPNCKTCVFYSQSKQINPIRESSFVRPEDLHIYDNVIDIFKLSGREHPSENIMKWIKAYGTRKHDGYINDIIDIPYQGSLIKNNAFPKNYGQKKSNCEHKCYKCDYCNTIVKQNKILENPFKQETSL